MDMTAGGLAEVIVNWTDDLSPAKLFLFSLTVSQYKATYRAGLPLKMD